MEIVRRVNAMKEVSRRARARGLKLGFVPTMGFLHEGHLSLIRQVKELTDVVVVSIFVNPTQFGENADLDNYPRDMTRDTDLCIAEGVDYLFSPDLTDMYPTGPRTYVDVGDLGARLEGASRPGHFRGVTTVVLKLHEIVRPHVMTVGQKDAQQVAVIRQMIRDLMLDVELLVVPTVREEDGLAVSSRNVRLSDEQRQAALAIPRALAAAREALGDGMAEAKQLTQVAHAVLEAEPGLAVDYIEIVDSEGLEPVDSVDGEALLVVAAMVGETRLIDNELLEHAS